MTLTRRALTLAASVAALATALATTRATTLVAARQPRAQPAAGDAVRGITAVDGISVGHHTLAERPTGCTVILIDRDGAVGGVSQRGAAPGTRETDLLNPLNLVDRVNAVVLTGGSAFGLESATGVVRWLEEHDRGFPTASGRVPIVPAAVIFDLGIGNPKIRPTADCGYRAAAAATSGRVQEGNIGAGAGATIGKLGAGAAAFSRPPTQAGDRATNGADANPSRGPGPMKAGVGTAAVVLPNGLVVGAIAVVNAAGDVVNPATGAVVAGARGADGTLADTRRLLRSGALLPPARPGQNTTIAVVATNATLTKTQASRLALMADDGLARAINPSHTMGDGDTVFALATGRWNGRVDATVIGGLAADLLAEAIVRAATEAAGIPGYPAARDLPRRP